jgi:cation diffusion facilitator CzcD-associated flavoprotein CzcO
MTDQIFDVVIVGAGLSGVGAACHLKDRCPDRSFVLLEGRQSIGGTWDIFRYPGIRSDSDMYTLGYNFRPWKEAKAIADGPSTSAAATTATRAAIPLTSKAASASVARSSIPRPGPRTSTMPASGWW